MKLKPIFLSLFLGSLITHSPTTKAVDWAALNDFAINAPLEHPYAFVLPSLIVFPVGPSLQLTALASLYGLKNYQNTISPLWAYPIASWLILAPFLGPKINFKDKKTGEEPSLFYKITGISIAAPITASILYVPCLALAYCFSK